MQLIDFRILYAPIGVQWLSVAMQKPGRLRNLLAFKGATRRSVAITAILGTLLNLFNQENLIPKTWFGLFQFILTYLLLYCASVYGAASYYAAKKNPK